VSLTGDGSAHRPGSPAYVLTQAALGGDEEGESDWERELERRGKVNPRLDTS
jgi:hypothetical protein